MLGQGFHAGLLDKNFSEWPFRIKVDHSPIHVGLKYLNNNGFALRHHAAFFVQTEGNFVQSHHILWLNPLQVPTSPTHWTKKWHGFARPFYNNMRGILLLVHVVLPDILVLPSRTHCGTWASTKSTSSRAPRPLMLTAQARSTLMSLSTSSTLSREKVHSVGKRWFWVTSNESQICPSPPLPRR